MVLRQSTVALPAGLYDRLVETVLVRYPLKSFGFLASPDNPFWPTHFLCLEDNIRNDDEWRDEFERRGRYFVDHPDAGFVATPEESWRAEQFLLERGLDEVAVFHTHRRHPGNFSDIDYDLHVSRFHSLWHLIISLRNPSMPQLRAFDVSPEGVCEMSIEVIA
jgi:proteasome lid subunit RPN8/RPN11